MPDLPEPIHLQGAEWIQTQFPQSRIVRFTGELNYTLLWILISTEISQNSILCSYQRLLNNVRVRTASAHLPVPLLIPLSLCSSPCPSATTDPAESHGAARSGQSERQRRPGGRGHQAVARARPGRDPNSAPIGPRGGVFTSALFHCSIKHHHSCYSS